MDDNLKKVLSKIEKGKQNTRARNDIAEEAKLCNVAGTLLAENRLFKLAIEEHNIELQLSESLNDLIAVAISHRKLGECLCECGDFDQAIVHQKQYLKLSMESKNLVEVQRALATIGRTYFQSDDGSGMVNAQTFFLKSLALCDQLRDSVTEKELLEMRARLYLNLGLVYNNLKDQKSGMKYIEKALAITRSQDLKDTEYRCQFSLGEIKLSENRPSEALQCFERARKVAQHQKNKFDEADTLVQMGQVLLCLGDFKAAKNILKKCYQTMKHGDLVDELRLSLIEAIKGTRLLEKLESSTHDETQMKTCEDLGDMYVKCKCYTNAVHYYLKQLELSEKLGKTKQEKAVICFSIAASYSDDKQYEKAKDYFYKELGLRDGELEEQCDTWCNIADVAKLAGDGYKAVESAYQSALVCAKDSKSEKKTKHLQKVLKSLPKKFFETDDGKLQESATSEENEQSQEVDEECTEEEENDEEGEGAQLLLEEMEFCSSEDDDDEQDGAPRVKRTINKRNEKGETSLHVAAINGNYHLAKTSLDKRISVHSRDYCGWQPLHEACNYGNLNIVELLLDRGADINDPGGPHCRGMTPLHDAVQNGHVEVVKLLITRGASVTQRNKDGDTPLDLVKHSIADDDDDDDVDHDLVRVRQKMLKILQNATTAIKPRSSQTPELKRRDKLQLSDNSDEDPCTSISEKLKQVFGRAEKSRKRKSASLEKRAKLPKVTDWTLMDMEGPVRTSEVSELMDDWGNNETSLDNMNGQGVFSGNSQNSPSSSQRKDIQVYSEPVDSDCLLECDNFEDVKSPTLKHVHFSENYITAFPNTTADPVTGSTLSKQEESQESPALIPENEYLETSAAASGWLIDDLPAKKPGKRKRSGNLASMFEASPRTVPQASNTNPSVQKTRQRQSRLSNHVVSDRSSPSELWDNSHDTPPCNLTSMLKASPRTQHSSKNPSIQKTRQRQSRLSNHVVSGRSSPSELGDNSYDTPAHTTVTPPMRLNVKVKEYVFLIPCPSLPGAKVQWLADQATLRYYSASGLKPILSLSTAEGSLLSPDDDITDVLSSNQQVVAFVNSWELPLVAQRYVEACISANTEPHQVIQTALQSNSQISNVEFCDMSLRPATLFPLFRALQYHDQLTMLMLPGNRMGNDGLRHLISCLPNMSNLVLLNLSGNGITDVGLRNLASALTEDDKISKVWSKLKDFDFSFNAISDMGASSLAMMLRFCPDLQKLQVEACSFGDNTFTKNSDMIQALQGLQNLRHLNVSHNQIGGKSIGFILGAIPLNSVKILNLSSTVNSWGSDLINSLTFYLGQEGCCVKELSCSGCYLKNFDLRIFARTNLKSLHKLDISNNGFGNEGVLALAESLHSNISFKHLNVAGNVKVTNHSLPQLLTLLSGLESLDLSSCSLLSPVPSIPKGFVMSQKLKLLSLSGNYLNEQDLSILTAFRK